MIEIAKIAINGFKTETAIHMFFKVLGKRHVVVLLQS